MKSRHWSIRSKIIALVTVPLSALVALWVFATLLTAGPALHLLTARTLLDNVGNPGEVLVGELQRERRLSVEFLSAPGPLPARLSAQRGQTDRAAADFRAAAGGDDAQDAASDELRARIEQVVSGLTNLADQRARIDRRETDAIGAQGIYTGMIDNAFDMFEASGALGDEKIDREIQGITSVSLGREYLGRVDSLLAGATVAGKFTEPVRTQLIQDVGTARFLLRDGVAKLPDDRRTAYEALNRGVYLFGLNRMLDTLVAQSRTGVVSPVSGNTWHAMYVTAADQLRVFGLDSADALADRTTPLAVEIIVRLAVAGLLGLIALVMSIVVSLKVGRSIVGRLRRLRGEAQEMAAERLPNVVRRLQRGEVVDVEVETPPLRYGRDEIGQLGRAFNDVQRTAVQSAVEEATVRRGLNEVFLNIARRSQTLLHRQLALLDKMERRETEPQELEDLYRVDHLATRMRRHAEDLVILAGAAPGRGWRNPVPVIDVIRGAISEVEDYKRVDIRSVEAAALLGRAVGDVIHLLAELLENAASYSPPHTRVQVSGQVLPNGYAVEIEDRGLGMTQEALDEANRRLVEPPDFDPADSARLGLFVVAQLANRHGIRVSLRASAFGGVTAIVLIPGELVAAGPTPAALPAGQSSARSGPDGPSGGDRPRDRPLVGSGTDDPARQSLAELQWQGTEELRQVTVAGRRPVTINGTATPIPRQRTEPRADQLGLGQRLEQLSIEQGGQHRADAGPLPSSIADGLSAEGLVQRRRRRPVDLGSATPPQAGPASAADLAVPPGSGARAVPRNSNPAMPTSASPLFPGSPPALPPSPSVPTSAAPMFVAPTSPAPNGNGSREPAAAGDPSSAEDGLPRRVRQASLAPQLRRPTGAPPAEEDSPLRSPEQMRSIMSALQRGTNRGRIDAARYGPDPTGAPRPDPAADGGMTGLGTVGNGTLSTDAMTGGADVRHGKRASTPPADADSVSEDRSNMVNPGDAGQSEAPSFADAATVSFPAIVNVALAGGEASSGAVPPAMPGRAGGMATPDPSATRPDVTGGPERDDVTRPDKDA